MTNSAAGADTGPFAALMRRPYLILILCNLFWGGNVVAGRLAVGHIDPYLLMLARWFGAIVLILPFVLGPLKQSWPVIRRNWPLYLFYGAFGYGTFNLMTYVAAHLTSGINIAIESPTIRLPQIIGLRAPNFWRSFSPTRMKATIAMAYPSVSIPAS